MVAREQFVNDASTTLNGAINDSTTSVTVTDGSVFPSDGNFRVIVEDEIMVVTARSTNTLTVTRGAESTTAASHSDGEDIIAIVTEDGLKAYVNEALGINPTQMGGNYTGRIPYRLLDIDGNTLTASDFTWINQGSSTLTDSSNGGLVLTLNSNSAGSEQLLYKAMPTPPFKITCHVEWGGGCEISTVGQRFGIGFYDLSTGEFTALAMEPGDQHRFLNWTSLVGSGSDATTSYRSEFDLPQAWLRFEDDNTDIKAYYSQDGLFWHQFGESARAANVTDADQVCMIFSQGGGDIGRKLSINAFVEHT